MFNKYFDVIVVGGGHSGIEASLAASRLNVNVLLITYNIDTIGQLSCNPSIGGIGKGHLVKEIDALDGAMAIISDKSGIQFKILNSSKGESVKSTRSQVDRLIYQKNVKKLIFSKRNITIIQQEVNDLIIDNYKVKGIITSLGIKIFSNTVILTMGTFLNGKIFIGNKFKLDGGRVGEKSSYLLSNNIKNKFLFDIKRFKTGTPPRIDSRSIDFSNLESQSSDYPIPSFSFLKNNNFLKQLNCFITKTNNNTHDIIKKNINSSPVYSDIIKGIGPRYCPSIEDKVIKFSNRDSHNIFLEPEGLFSYEIYPNGISTSLPIDVQIKFIRTIKGLENAYITRPGYSIEYDYFNPKHLNITLESKLISNLFFAGQINGTTGYEEAAAQGIVAGINAARLSKNKDLWLPDKNISYIGVLIDDICNKDINEPYRMFTSRSNNRLYLREDNADIRLTKIGYYLGVVSEYRWNKFNIKNEILNIEKNRLKSIFIDKKYIEKLKLNINFKENKINCFNLFKISNVDDSILYKIPKVYPLLFDKNIYREIFIESKYENYINKQNNNIKNIKYLNNIIIPNNINFYNIKYLSNEAIHNLNLYKPSSISELYNIPGINIDSINIILIWLKKNNFN